MALPTRVNLIKKVNSTITIDVVRIIITSGVLIIEAMGSRISRSGMRLGKGIKSEVWASRT
jgi:hypothetical protein